MTELKRDVRRDAKDVVVARFRKVTVLVVILLASGCALPRWPVNAAMTSPFGLRMDGWLPAIHRGVDLATPTGTPVRAMADANVVFAGELGGYGTVIILQHGTNTRTVYAHLSKLNVERGARVRRGDVIGLSGASGNASGPHLHFEIQRWGRATDPVPLLGGPPAVR